MKNYCYIIGVGGHGRVINSIVKDKYDKVYFVDKDKSIENVIYQDDFFENLTSYEDIDTYLGIGNDEIRKELFDALLDSDLKLANCISPNAFVDGTVKMGKGVFIGHGCVIGNNTEIGDNVIINTNTSIDHDCKVGSHTQITAGISVGGFTTISDNCFVGIGSTILNNITIEERSIVMAGSVVFKNVERDFMVGGNPARKIKILNL